MDDVWSIFGDPPPTSPVGTAGCAPAPAVPATAASSNRDALAPFADANGDHVVVPPPPRLTAAADVNTADALCVWPEHPPRVVGPIAVRQIPGSGRGFVAARDISPGQVLIWEQPFVPWPSAEREPLSLLQSVLRRSAVERRVALAALSRLHPMELRSVSAFDRPRLEEEHCACVDALLQEPGAADLGGGLGDEGRRAELLRLCLVCRWNAFASGLFLHQSIFNHAPSRRANADKAALRAGGTLTSVVRATRHIAQGQEVLICYAQPAELIPAACSRHLDHFDFTSEAERHCEWDAPPRSASEAGVAEADELTLTLEAGAREAVRRAAREGPGGGVDEAACAAALRELARGPGERTASSRRSVVHVSLLPFFCKVRELGERHL